MNQHRPPGKPVTVSVAEAKARFSELLAMAANGEDIHVTRHGKPYARIGPEKADRPRLPRVGAYEGQFKVPDDWDSIPTGFEPYMGNE